MFLLQSAGWGEVGCALGVSSEASVECFRHQILKLVSPMDQKSNILIYLCPLYVFRDKWFSIIDLHEVQNKMVTKSRILLLTVWGQQIHSLMNYSSSSGISKPICLLFLVKKTPSLGYHSYRVTEVQHVWCFDDKMKTAGRKTENKMELQLKC